MILTVVTTKNRPNELTNALESINNQTRVPDQVVVVSDSLEQNYIVEKSLCDKYGYTLIKNETTHNYPSSLNIAIKYFIKDKLNLLDEDAFNGTYVAILDDDDTWDPKYLETCESALTNNQDFVVTGLIRKGDIETHEQSIPHDLSIDDFLKGNPHIQGSNTFVKLSTLLKAGLFDENMSSCNDRDIFIRIMMLKPTYSVVDAHLVTVNASDFHKRITNTYTDKLDGLKKFYYKYQDLMSDEVKEEFFTRNKKYFNIRESDITNLPVEAIDLDEADIETSVCYSSAQDINLIVGYVASSYTLGLRLLNELIDSLPLYEADGSGLFGDRPIANNIRTKIVILINFNESVVEYKKVLNKSGIPYVLLRKDDYKQEVIDNGVVPTEHAYLFDKEQIEDISATRTILQYYLYKESDSDDDVFWILDDDMEIRRLYQTPHGQELSDTFSPYDLMQIIQTRRLDTDVLVGSYTGAAPVPLLSTLRCQLVDYLYSSFTKKDKRSYHLDPVGDYYYDLTIEGSSHLETPYSFSSYNLDDIFNGAVSTRPLYYQYEEPDESVNSRGGNTILFNRELLKIPNYSLSFSDKRIARRSDYLWLLKCKEKGARVKKTNFSTYHNRGKVGFNYEKEERKLLSDLVGSSYTHALEKVQSKKAVFLKSEFNKFYLNRLTNYVCSYMRIIGILEIVGSTKYLEYFNLTNLQKFTKKCLDCSDFDNLEVNIDNLEINYKNFANIQDFREKFIEIINDNLNPIGNLSQLGYGQEGITFKDNNYVYKCFFTSPTNLDYLKNISSKFNECSILYEIEIFTIDDIVIIRYPYEKSSAYDGEYQDQLIDFLSFLKKNDIAFTNFKRENFVVNQNGELKLIDYGYAFRPLSLELEDRMYKRVYEMLSYPTLNPAQFKQLINLSYSGSSLGLDYNYNNIKLLTQKRSKTQIHDDKIKELIDKYKPYSLFDYGAGRCAIANSYVDKCKVGVYDIDQDTLNQYRDPRTISYEAIEDVEDNSYDLIISNLVLCSVDNDMVDFILTNTARILPIGGHFIISVCNPFFNDISQTEDRASTECPCYGVAGYFGKKSVKGMTRVEYQRDIDFYINELQRNGFEITNTYEIDSVDKDTLNNIGEFLVFECELKVKVKPMDDCTLLIKGCLMDHNHIYDNIKHIVLSLEKGDKFTEKILFFDANEHFQRVRKYDEDDYIHFLSEINRAVDNGLITRYMPVVSSIESAKEEYQEYFRADATNFYSAHGEPTLMNIFGFDIVQSYSRYVYQTDCDILFYNPSWGMVSKKLEETKRLNALTSCFACPRKESLEPELGTRVEVRSSFIDLLKLGEKLPIENEVNDNTLQLSWYRSLDKALSKEESVRFRDTDICIIHPDNSLKNDPRFLGIVRKSLSKGYIPASQYGSIDLVPDLNEWITKPTQKLIVYSRGYNTSIEKIKRMLDSLVSQSYKDYNLVYIDDGSTNGGSDYLSFISTYDSRFKDKTIYIPNRSRVGTLDNFVFSMQNIITDKDSIIVNLDNDDALIKDTALERILAEFNSGADLTCGNLFRTNKPLKKYKINSFNKVYLRRGDNVWLHPKCFKRYLFDSIDIDKDLKIDGEYVNNCIDYAFILPMIEAAKKPVFIDEELYYYDPCEDNNNLVNEYSKENERKIKNILLERRKENGK